LRLILEVKERIRIDLIIRDSIVRIEANSLLGRANTSVFKVLVTLTITPRIRTIWQAKVGVIRLCNQSLSFVEATVRGAYDSTL
jgi:hypothetical protein